MSLLFLPLLSADVLCWGFQNGKWFGIHSLLGTRQDTRAGVYGCSWDGSEDPLTWMCGRQQPGLGHDVHGTLRGPKGLPSLRSRARIYGDWFESILVYWSSAVCQGVFNVSRDFFHMKERPHCITAMCACPFTVWNQVNVQTKVHLRFRSW